VFRGCLAGTAAKFTARDLIGDESPIARGGLGPAFGQHAREFVIDPRAVAAAEAVPTPRVSSSLDDGLGADAVG